MTQILRQSTQVIVVIGPFVDVTDGFTPETGITLGAADEAELLKSNTTTTTDISGATWAAITGCDGWYGLTLSSSHTDTVGALTVMVNDDSVCLPVFARFQVIEEAIYDGIYTASAAVIPANVTQFGGSAGTFSGGRPEVNTSHVAGSAVSTSSAQIGVNVVNAGGTAWASGSLTSGVFASGAITATAIAADAIGASELAADAVAEIADAVWDEDATAHQTGGTFGQAIGDPGADTNTIFKATVTDATGATVGVDVAAVLADTGTDGVIVASIANGAITAAAIATNAIDADSLAADAVTEIQSGLATAAALDTVDNFIDTEIATIVTAVGAIETDTQDIQARLPAALVSGRIDASVGAMAANVMTAAAAAADLTTELQSGLATATDLATVDTVVDAIKAKTDSLTFTVAGQVDSNIQSVNDVTVTGTGAEGDEWGP